MIYSENKLVFTLTSTAVNYLTHNHDLLYKWI